MSTELRPRGVRCNLACQYCYQNVLRDAGGDDDLFDFEAVKQAIIEADEPFHLFGGEPLLLPYQDLEALLEFAAGHRGCGGIQTNGVLLTDAHIRLFERHGLSVGVSVDGPGALNDARWAGSVERTRAATAKTMDAIERLVAAEMPPSLMIQLTRCNAVGPALERLCEWLGEMDALGVPAARIHILELDGTAAREGYGLTVAENIAAFRRIAGAAKSFASLRLDLLNDQRALLMMQDASAACVFRGCDPLYTEAVTGLGGGGTPHKCGLTDKEGVNFLRPEAQGFERYLALHATPQQVGGCAGCRFFAACKGQCPGTGIDGDWRNRSENCEAWRDLFGFAEAELLAEGRTPLSLHPLRGDVESHLVAGWAVGENVPLEWIRDALDIDLGPEVEGFS